jgi:hypothetical protein
MEQQNSNHVINVIFYYTPEFARVTTNVKEYIDGLVSNANVAYNNSNITLEMRAFCMEEWVGFEETDDPVGMILEFPYVRGTFLKAAYCFKIVTICFFRPLKIASLNVIAFSTETPWATLNTADAAILVLSGPIQDVCGIAYVNGYEHGFTFGWVGKNCQTVVTGHEVFFYTTTHQSKINGKSCSMLTVLNFFLFRWGTCSARHTT